MRKDQILERQLDEMRTINTIEGLHIEITALKQRLAELTCQKTALQQVVSERDEEIWRLKLSKRLKRACYMDDIDVVRVDGDPRGEGLPTVVTIQRGKMCKRYVPEDTDRITELEDLLRSAHAIAMREGTDTNWARFAASIQKLGIGSVTARVYKLDRAVGCAEAIRAVHLEEPE